jgi:hypothetical protein
MVLPKYEELESEVIVLQGENARLDGLIRGLGQCTENMKSTLEIGT